MPRKQHDHHFIYKTVCVITSRYYIGMHSTSNLHDGYLGSGKRLRYSINKHGRENHTIEILEFLSDRDSLKTRERELVTENLIKDPMCMNLMIGGEGGSSFSGRKHTKETINKIKNDVKLYPEKYRDKAIRGYRTKLAKGNNPIDWTGRKHSAETISRMRQKGSLRVGDKNSQFDTVWIFKDEEKRSIKIKSTVIDLYLSQGWIKGRKIKF